MAESRKTVTIVFADVTGSTALGEQTDPEAMRRIMERYFEEMRAVLEKHGGTVEKFIGDAVMAVFGIPVVHEDDALRAVRAATEMRTRLAALNDEFERDRGVTIAVRTGVNTGEVVAGDPADGQAFATGDAVNVAARLEQAAEPGEILLGELTYRLVRDAVRTEEIAPLELKGKSAAATALRLLDVLPDVPAFTRRLDAPFVGRTRELEALREVFAKARETRSCVLVTITGAPGIGKSRLVRELASASGDEARILVGRCLPYGEGITYWPIAEIVHQIAGADPQRGLARLLAEEQDGELAVERVLGAIGASDQAARTEEIFWAVRTVLEKLARERPVVVVLDDIHWAEPTLLDMIEYVAGFASGPILLACTARPDLFDTRPHWAQTDTIELRALADSDANDLIDALLGQSGISGAMHEQITERAEGNPLFVEQMVALAGENGAEEIAVPATIQALLEARLDRLDSPERAILVRGAVEGRLFHRGAVSALLPEEDRDAVTGRLLGLARKEFVRPDAALFPGDDAFRFVHALVREAAYEAAPKELRADLHERFAGWVEDRAGDQLPELEEIVGYHLEQSVRLREDLGLAGDDARLLASRAGERLAAAGERAVRRGDHRAAANLLERAHALLPPGERRLELVAPLGIVLYETGRVEDAQRLHGGAIAEARSAGFVNLLLLSELELNRIRLGADPSWSADEALALIERAIPVLEASGDERGLVQAFELLHDVEWMRGRLASAVAAAELSLAAADRIGDINLAARMREGASAARWFGGTPIGEMTADVERSLQWAKTVGHRALEANSLFALGWAAIEQQAFEEGRRLCEQGIAQLDDLGLVVHAAGQRSHFRWGEMVRDPSGVERRMTLAYETLKGAGETGFLSTVAAHRAFLLARRDELDEAWALAEESEGLGSEDDVATHVGWRIAKAMVLARREDPDGAEVLAREALRRAGQREYVELIAGAHLCLADVLGLAGRSQEARAETESALAIFENKGMMDSAAAVRAELAELQSSGPPSQ